MMPPKLRPVIPAIKIELTEGKSLTVQYFKIGNSTALQTNTIYVGQHLDVPGLKETKIPANEKYPSEGEYIKIHGVEKKGTVIVSNILIFPEICYYETTSTALINFIKNALYTIPQQRSHEFKVDVHSVIALWKPEK
jgi:hypothetical protein